MKDKWQGLKVLPLDWPTDGFWIDLIIEDFENYNVEIKPLLSRNGRYYDRHKRVGWIEVNSRAWLTSDTLKYEIEQYGHRPLTNKVAQAVAFVLKSGVKNEKLRKLLYKDDCWKETRAVGRDVQKAVLCPLQRW